MDLSLEYDPLETFSFIMALLMAGDNNKMLRSLTRVHGVYADYYYFFANYQSLYTSSVRIKAVERGSTSTLTIIVSTHIERFV